MISILISILIYHLLHFKSVYFRVDVDCADATVYVYICQMVNHF